LIVSRAPAEVLLPNQHLRLADLIRSGAGGLVSNEITFVVAGTGPSAFCVNTGQPPTDTQAPRFG
jgi:hypothetical protein